MLAVQLFGEDHLMTPVDTHLAIEPALVRVSVLGGNTQLDVALPAAVPIAALMGDLDAQIESRNPARRDPDHPDSEASAGGRPHDRQNRWTLALVGQNPLALNRSLSESGIRDGDLLLLTSTRTGESPVLFDDVVDAVARLNESRFVSWSAASARHVGYGLAIVAAVAGSVALGSVRRTDGTLWVAGLGGLLAITLITAATIVSRYYRDTATSTILSLCAMPAVCVTGMLITPGQFGAAHLTLGFAMTLAAAVVSYRVTGTGPATHSAVTSVALLGLLGCGARVLIEASVADVAAVVAAVGLLVLALAPRATIVLAKLPLPPVPTAGAPIDVDDLEPRPAIEGIGAIGAMALPKADALESRSYVANAYLTGIIVGVTAVTTCAAILAAAPYTGFNAKTTVFAFIIGAVLCLRGRSHTDLIQAATLIIGGAVTVIAVIAGLAFGDDRWPVVGFTLAVLVLAASIVFGVIAPKIAFSPVMRRSAEVLEYVLVTAIVPLLLWILDLYRMVREL